MRKKLDVELDKAQLLKAVRSFVRLRHSLAADAELNEVLPKVEAEYDKAIAAGKVYELDFDPTTLLAGIK